MIVDYNKFTPGQQKLNPGLLVVLEQIPWVMPAASSCKVSFPQSQLIFAFISTTFLTFKRILTLLS